MPVGFTVCVEEEEKAADWDRDFWTTALLSPLKEVFDGLLYAGYPGQYGGEAIARILFGETVPSGKLAVSIPDTVGQPACYNYRNTAFQKDYLDQNGAPVYSFGYGLSYASLLAARFRLNMQVKALSLAAHSKSFCSFWQRSHSMLSKRVHKSICAEKKSCVAFKKYGCLIKGK